MPTPTQKLKTTTEIKKTHEISTRTPDWIDSITLATPILTFLLGYFLNKLVEDYKENQRLNQIKEYYFSLLKTLVKAINSQAGAIDETAVKIKSLKGNQLLIPRFPSLQTSRIKAITDLDLYKAFILRRKDTEENDKQLTNIAGSIDFITDSISKLEEFNKEFFEKSVAFQKNFNNDAREILRMKNTFVVNARRSGEKPSDEVDFLIRRFSFHINNHKKKNGTSSMAEPMEIYNNLIDPLFTDLKTTEPTTETYPFTSLIDNCKADFLRFFAFRDAHVSRIQIMANSLRSTKEIIEQAVEALRNQK